MAFIDAASETLTGVWQGLYNHQGGQVSFTATLMELGPMLSGTTHEVMDGDELFAMVDGRRSGRDVRFTKTYDGSGRFDHSLAYEGRLSADGTEVEGRWSAAGFSGTFMMIRSGGKSASVAKRAYEVV
jgi:hypothetical protein